MYEIGKKVREYREANNGALPERHQVLLAEGRLTSPQDFEYDRPREGSSTLTIVYRPDKRRQLSDPRNRVMEYDLDTGEYEVEDRYPAGVKFIAVCIIGIIAGGSFLLVWRISRPLQRSDRWGWRMLTKQIEDESQANALMARIRDRQP